MCYVEILYSLPENVKTSTKDTHLASHLVAGPVANPNAVIRVANQGRHKINASYKLDQACYLKVTQDTNYHTGDLHINVTEGGLR